MNDFIKEKNIATFGFLLPMLTQTPIFLSMFWGLRKMTNLPVESMTTGGILWFENLTISDPYYALPIIIGSTMFLIIEVCNLLKFLFKKIMISFCLFYCQILHLESIMVIVVVQALQHIKARNLFSLLLFV